MIKFILGLILGILLNPAKQKTEVIIKEYKEKQENKGNSQFYEAVPFEEKFKQASTIDDLIK